MDLTEKIRQLIRLEIDEDPFNVGYAGKTDEEIMNLLNNPQEVQVMKTEIRQSPINRILNGIPATPNAVSENDVVEAKKISDVKTVEEIRNA